MTRLLFLSVLGLMIFRGPVFMWSAADIGVFSLETPAFGQEAKPYYAGKRIRLITGGSPGSGPDLGTRLYARHLPKHIPGNPQVFVQNMPGAGWMIFANYLYNVAKPDGLTLGSWEAPLIVTQLARAPGVRYDVKQLEYIGAAIRSTFIVIVRGDLPYDTIDKLRNAKAPLVAPTRRVGSSDHVTAKALEALGVPIKYVFGYPSSPEQLAAIERGEGDVFATDILSLQTIRPEWAKPGGPVHLIVSVGREMPETRDTPNLLTFEPIPGQEGFVLIADFLARFPRRVLVAPPKTPAGLVETLRDAFNKMVKDQAFLAEAHKLNVHIDPASGAELTKLVNDFTAQQSVKDLAPEFVK